MILEAALLASSNIDQPSTKSYMLGTIANSAGDLRDVQQAATLLEVTLEASTDLNEPSDKSSVLQAIAIAVGQLAAGPLAANPL